MAKLFTLPDDPELPTCGTGTPVSPHESPDIEPGPTVDPALPMSDMPPEVKEQINKELQNEILEVLEKRIPQSATKLGSPIDAPWDEGSSYPNISDTPSDFLLPEKPYIDPNLPYDFRPEPVPLSVGDKEPSGSTGSGNGSGNASGNGSGNDVDVHIDKVEVNIGPGCDLVRDPYGSGDSGGGSNAGDGGRDSKD